ncbi:MAG: glycoside hydrolase family 3 N-terminal domain-containing protein [Actinomycetota bacterium]|nr:glycoside hydrolase family 3 N-terminal domain-containing protein [Actinomycetota bacterium]
MIDDLLARMTLDEKCAQLGCVWTTALLSQGDFDSDAAAVHLQHGIGQITRIGATTGLRPRERAALTNQIQRYLVEHTRLGIPAIVHEESTAGLCARDATQFPQAIGLASAWDPQLLERIGEVIREQMVATGARHTLAPVLDVARDPRWGRVEETYGESAYLASRLGVAYVRGVQGTLTDGVAATGKHFLGYGLSEGGMNHAPVHLGPRELREVYAEPFRAAIAEAGLATVMNAYNSIDGLACGGSKAILDDLLRGELGFEGAVVADYGTTGLLISHHRVAETREDAARIALTAGLDMELPQLDCYGAPLAALVGSGEVDIALVDRSVRRVLALKTSLGLFDQPFVDEAAADAAYHRPEHRALAREAARASIVLLENDGTLPLAPGIRLAVVGPAADEVRLLQGDYSYPAHTEIMGIDLPFFPESVTPRAGLAARFALTEPETADVVVCCVGGKSGLMADCTSGEFRDVTDLGLPGEQRAYVEALLDGDRPVVVVVLGGRVHALPWLVGRAAAVVYAWCPGEQGGAGLADVLSGDVDATGRLPVTVPRNVGQVPSHHDHRAGGGRSQMLGDYVDAPAAPLYRFGFGLSYTTFAYGALRVGAVTTTEPFTVTVDVTNTGTRPGVEVVQLFGRDEVARVARPRRQLLGFTRLPLAPGETQSVAFTVDPTVFAYYDEAMHLVVEPGALHLNAGGQTALVTMSGAEREIAPNDRRPTTVTFG